MGSIQKKSLDTPDEVRHFAIGTADLVRVGSLTVGRGVLKPGWRWSTGAKPTTDTPSCQIRHRQVLLAGLEELCALGPAVAAPEHAR
jgi:hypothetical protein